MEGLLPLFSFNRGIEGVEMSDLSVADAFKRIEALEKRGKFSEAVNSLTAIYKEHKSKKFLYKLCELYLKTRELIKAEECYLSFVNKYGETVDSLILRYKLDEYMKKTDSVLISDLVAVKRIDYIEEYGFKLALLYDKVGDYSSCLSECMMLMEWFGETAFDKYAPILKEKYLTDIKRGCRLSKEIHTADSEPDENYLKLAVSILAADDYEITESDKISLKKLISGLKSEEEVEVAVRKVINAAETRNMKNLLYVVMSSSYKRSSLLKLAEEDFET